MEASPEGSASAKLGHGGTIRRQEGSGANAISAEDNEIVIG